MVVWSGGTSCKPQLMDTLSEPIIPENILPHAFAVGGSGLLEQACWAIIVLALKRTLRCDAHAALLPLTLKGKRVFNNSHP